MEPSDFDSIAEQLHKALRIGATQALKDGKIKDTEAQKYFWSGMFTNINLVIERVKECPTIRCGIPKYALSMVAVEILKGVILGIPVHKTPGLVCSLV